MRVATTQVAGIVPDHLCVVAANAGAGTCTQIVVEVEAGLLVRLGERIGVFECKRGCSERDQRHDRDCQRDKGSSRFRRFARGIELHVILLDSVDPVSDSRGLRVNRKIRRGSSARSSRPLARAQGSSQLERALTGPTRNPEEPEMRPLEATSLKAAIDVKERAISDSVVALICHGVFDRHPKIEVAAVETGSS